jgi:hypothetical protein
MDLSGVGLKIRRAERQTAELKAAMKAGLDPEHYVIARKYDAQTRDHVYSVEKLPPLDPEWAVIIGEILFNLRSALDHFAWQLVRLDGGEPGEHTQFPIHDTPFDKKGNLKRIDLSPPIKNPEILDAIKKAQPYNGMDGERLDMHPLLRLNLMNNWDKHRLLLLTVQVLNVNRIYWGANEGDPNPSFRFSRKPLKDGSPVAWFNFGEAERPPHFDPNLTLTVAVNEPLTRHGKMARLVEIGTLLGALCWGVAQYTIAAKFLHLMPLSESTALYPGDIAPYLIAKKT